MNDAGFACHVVVVCEYHVIIGVFIIVIIVVTVFAVHNSYFVELPFAAFTFGHSTPNFIGIGPAVGSTFLLTDKEALIQSACRSAEYEIVFIYAFAVGLDGVVYNGYFICHTADVVSENFKGRLYHPQLHSGEQFHSAIHFLRKMERLLDATKFPQAFSTPRAFGASAAGKGSAAVGTGPRTGKIATFTVRVIFRQNASWQGSVAWLEGGSEQRFRSVLELLLLLDSALESASQMEKSG